LVIDVVLHFILPVRDSGKTAEEISASFEISRMIHEELSVPQTPPLSFARKSQKASETEIGRRICPLRLKETKDAELTSEE